MTHADHGGENVVRYSTKELLTRIEAQIQVIALELRTKAEAAKVEAIDRRVIELERTNLSNMAKDFAMLQKDLIDLKAQQMSKSAVEEYRKYIVGITILILGSFGIQIYNLLRVMMGSTP